MESSVRATTGRRRFIRPFAAAIPRSAVALPCLAVTFALLAMIAPAAQALGASLAASPAGQSAGGTVTLSGSGYLPGAPVTFTFDGNPIPTTPSSVTSGPAGGFGPVKITVPSGSSVGQHSIAASDGVNTATTNLNVDWLSASPAGQSRGGVVTLSGSGFTPNSTVSFAFGGTTISTTPASVTTDAAGSFSNVQATVPSNASLGSHPLTATDAANDTATLPLSVDSISVSPTAGDPDNSLSVTGAGWPAGDAVQAQLGGFTVCQLVASAQGAIKGDQSNGCRVPPGLIPGNTYSVTATDLTTGSEQATGNSFLVLFAPIAAFTGPSAASPGTAMTFDPSSSWAPDQIESYDWNWGDGTPDTVNGTLATATHTYATVGTYIVTLTITDGDGQSNSVSHAVSIQGPVAAFTPSAATVLAGSSVPFDGTASSDPDGSITSYSWNFGDGGTSTSPQPTHKYMQTGTFTASLTVTDNAGDTASVTHQITVIAPPPLQTLILTPLAAPVLVKAGAPSTTAFGLVKLGQWAFCPGPGAACEVAVVATSRAVRAAGAAGGSARGARRVGHSHAAISANASAAVKFRLSKPARSYLRQYGRLPITVTIIVTRGDLTAKRVHRLTLRS